jgi:hypothetical protein
MKEGSSLSFHFLVTLKIALSLHRQPLSVVNAFISQRFSKKINTNCILKGGKNFSFLFAFACLTGKRDLRRPNWRDIQMSFTLNHNHLSLD